MFMGEFPCIYDYRLLLLKCIQSSYMYLITEQCLSKAMIIDVIVSSFLKSSPEVNDNGMHTVQAKRNASAI